MALKNKYPSFKEACTSTIKEFKYDSVAFSKTFAVNKEAHLFFEGSFVGYLDSNLAVSLKKEFCDSVLIMQLKSLGIVVND